MNCCGNRQRILAVEILLSIPARSRTIAVTILHDSTWPAIANLVDSALYQGICCARWWYLLRWKPPEAFLSLRPQYLTPFQALVKWYPRGCPLGFAEMLRFAA